MRPALALIRNGLAIVRNGQLRFRLETFGLYYPSLPYLRPIWRVSPRVALLFLRQLPAYSRWLAEMRDLERTGTEGWWRTQWRNR